MKKQCQKGRGTFKNLSLSRDYFHNQLIQFDISQFSDLYLKWNEMMIFKKSLFILVGKGKV